MLGSERELFLMIGLIGAIVGLCAMAKVNPVLNRMYVRHTKYRNFYPAHATPFAPGMRHGRR